MPQSCLTDPSVPIVADTSAVINLNASGCAAAVLQALPNRMVLTDTVLAELRTDKRTGRDDAKLIRSLIDADLVAVAALADLKKDHFSALVAGPAAETLDDGEAATVAYALEMNAVAIIDDGKAVALCSRKYPKLVVASTVDVFAHDAIVTALAHGRLSDAVYAALQKRLAARLCALHRKQGGQEPVPFRTSSWIRQGGRGTSGFCLKRPVRDCGRRRSGLIDTACIDG